MAQQFSSARPNRRRCRLAVEQLESRSLPSATAPLDLFSDLNAKDIFGESLFDTRHATPRSHLPAQSNPSPANGTTTGNAAVPITGILLTQVTSNPVSRQSGITQSEPTLPVVSPHSGQLPSYTPQHGNDLVDQLIQQILSISTDYQSFFENVTAWIYQSLEPNQPSPSPPGTDQGDYYLQQMTGQCAARDVVMEEVAQRLALNDPSANIDVRRVNLYGVPTQVGHTITEVFIPTSSGTNSWELFDATFGIYLTLPNDTIPLSISAARETFPNVRVMQAAVPAAWTGVWPSSSEAYEYHDLDVVFPSSQTAGSNNNFNGVDIERTYFISDVEDSGLTPYSYLRLSVDLNASSDGSIGTIDGSFADVANTIEQLSNESVPTSIAGATGQAGNQSDLTQFLFRSPVTGATQVEVTVTTTEQSPLLFGDVDQLNSSNYDTGVAISTSGNSVTFSFDVYQTGTTLTLYTAWNQTLHFDQLQWVSPVTPTEAPPSVGVQFLSEPSPTLLGYPTYIDMSSNGGSFSLQAGQYMQLWWIGAYNTTYDLGQNVQLPEQDVVLAPQLIFYSPSPTQFVLTIPYSGSGPFSATISSALNGGGIASYTLAPKAEATSYGTAMVFFVALDHPFTTITFNAAPNATIYPSQYQGSVAAQLAYVIDGTGQLWLLEGGISVNTGAFATRVAASQDKQGNPEAYFTDGSNQVWRYDNGVFTNLGFYATRLAAAPGELAFTDGNDEVWLYFDATNAALNIHADATRLAGGGDSFGNEFVLTDPSNRLIIIDRLGNVKSTGGYATHIAIGLDQDGFLEVWFTDGSNQVWRLDNGVAAATGAFATQIAGSSEGLYFLDGRNEIWSIGDDGNAQATGAFGTALASSPEANYLFFLDSNNQIWLLENQHAFGSSAYGAQIAIL